MKHRYPHVLAILALLCLIPMAGAQAQWVHWSNYLDGSVVGVLLNDGGFVWAGSLGGGLVKIEKVSGNKTYYDRATSGLRNMTINAMLADGNGNIWIGTDGGLMKFDKGTNWTAYNMNNSPLPSNAINALAYHNGTLWVATLAGLAKLDGSGGWETYSMDNTNMIDNKLTSVSVTSSGTVWIGTVSKGLMKYNGSDFTSIRKGATSTSSDSITTINADLNGEIWVGEATGHVTQIDADGKRLNDMDIGLPNQPNFEVTVRPIHEIRPGPGNSILFSTYTGLAVWDRATTITRYPTSTTSNQANEVFSAFGDADNSIWAGTQTGVAENRTGSYVKTSITHTGMYGNNVGSVMVDKTSNVWLGSKSAAMEYDGATKWTVAGPMSFGFAAVINIALDSSGNYWVTKANGIAKKNGNAYQSQTVPGGGRKYGPIVVDRSGVIWIGSDAGLLKYDGTTWTAYNSSNSDLGSATVTALALDKNSSAIWIGTGFNGIFKYDGSTWTHYSNNDNPDIGSDIITSLAVDRTDGSLWAGTADAGFTHYDGSKWKNYSSSNSQIPSDAVTGISSDKYGAVWVSTGATGLVKFKNNNWNVFSNENSGLTEDRLTSVFVDNNQRVWVGTVDGGLVMYDEQAVLGVENGTAAGASNGMSIANVPNPFTAATMLHVTLPERTQARVSVMDARGQEVALLHEGIMDAGEHVLPFQAAGLPSGAYFVRIVANGTAVSHPMIVTR
ncbi:MAG TPA: two-component regulator propeller domain-containing protein [Candidatus Kapabacteria bacterium]|nr:two-component regulator propeller domain-containing protein [Candidatus Kapabacteria bacterium]